MVSVEIIGTGSYQPKTIVTNKQLLKDYIKCGFNTDEEKQKLSKNGVDTSKMNNEDVFDEWVKRVTGISERRIYKGDLNSSEKFIGPTENMALEASKKAIEKANIGVEEIDYILFATFTPALTIPNPACSLSHILGMKNNVGGIQINTACSGFIDGLVDAYCRIKSEKYKTILVAASETLSIKTDYNDLKTAVLFADGAGAAVLRTTDKDDKGILSVHTGSDYHPDNILLRNSCLIEMGGGPKVLGRAIKAMEDSTRKVLGTKYSTKDIDYLIPHQANGRIIEGLRKALDLPENRICNKIGLTGNTSAASVAISLDESIRNGEIKEGYNVVLTAVGGGYTYGALLVRF